jgi:hypothetical protein
VTMHRSRWRSGRKYPEECRFLAASGARALKEFSNRPSPLTCEGGGNQDIREHGSSLLCLQLVPLAENSGTPPDNQGPAF